MNKELEKLTNNLATGVAKAMNDTKVDPKRFGFMLLVTDVDETAYATTADLPHTLARIEHVANKLRAEMGLPPIPVPE